MRGNAHPDGRPFGVSELRLCTEVHRIKFAYEGVPLVCNAIFRLTMSCYVTEIFAIKSQSCPKSRWNFDAFGGRILQNLDHRQTCVKV